MYEQETSACMCCVVKINKKHVCLTNCRILLILSHVCESYIIYIYIYTYILYIYIIYILYIYYIYIIYIHIYILWEGKKCFEKLIFYHDKNLTMNCLFYFVCIYNSSKLVSLVFI